MAALSVAESLFPARPGLLPYRPEELDAKAVLHDYLTRQPKYPPKEESKLPDAYFRREDELRFEDLPLGVLQMIQSPIWCFDISLGRFIWWVSVLGRGLYGFISV